MAKARQRRKLNRGQSAAGNLREPDSERKPAGEVGGHLAGGGTPHCVARAEQSLSAALGDKNHQADNDSPFQKESAMLGDRIGNHDSSVSSLIVEKSRLNTELTRLRVKFDSLNETYLQTLQARIALEKSFRATRKENELLLLQLYHLSDDADGLACEKSEKATSCFDEGYSQPASIFQADRVVFGHVEPSPPHQHLDIDFHGVRVNSQELGHIRLRLVEHHGRAGIVVLSTTDSSHPMQYWRQDGVEDGCAYMLVVPQDEHGKAYIRQARARDLILLRQAALYAVEQLAGDAWTTSEYLPAFWRDVATRFVAFLDEANDRVCPGEINIEPDLNRMTVHFRIFPVVVHGETLAELSGTWAAHQLTLNLPSSGTPPLTAWPRAEDGSLVPSIKWSFHTQDRRKTARFAESFPRKDRKLIALLLRELIIYSSTDSSRASADYQSLAAAWRSDFPLVLRTLLLSDESHLQCEGRVRVVTRFARRLLRLK